MIQIVPGLPPHVAGFRAIGAVTRHDYKKVVYPVVNNVVKAFGKINYLLIIETTLDNYTVGAWMDDALLGIKYFTRWNKIGIVSGNENVKKFTNTFGILIPGETKGFLMDELPLAKEWVSLNV